MKTSVLYISYDGMTDQLGQSQVIPYLIGLSAKGYSITLMSFEKNKQLGGKANIAALLNKHNIAWIPMSYTARPPVVSTFWDYVKMCSTAAQIVKKKKIAIVHCRSYIAAMAGLWLKRKCSIKFVFDMRGFWADERVEGGIWNIQNPLYKGIYKFFKKQEILFFNNADYVICLTEAGKKELRSWETLRKDIPIQVIPCCADLQHFDYRTIQATETDTLRAQLHILPSDMVITYLGSIGTWYLLDEMLSFFKAVLAEYPTAKLFFITADAPETILSKARNKGIAQASIRIQKASRKELPALLSMSSLSLFFIKPSFSKTASSPTKMGELMGMGIPLVCNANVGDVEHIMNNTQAGYVLHDFSDAAFKDAVHELVKLQAIPKEKIRQGAQKWYSLDEGVRKYSEVYKCLVK